MPAYVEASEAVLLSLQRFDATEANALLECTRNRNFIRLYPTRKAVSHYAHASDLVLRVRASRGEKLQIDAMSLERPSLLTARRP